MPQQMTNSVENNFSGGLKTEFSPLNFPENACTDTDNCIFSIIGTVNRRPGINNEAHAAFNAVPNASKAINTYKWNNVGGEGSTKILVKQIGSALYFYRSTSATLTSPLSTTLFGPPIDLNTFYTGTGDVAATECQFTDGNGYLFVFHPSCTPFYCKYSAGVISGTAINIKIRDFTGIPEIGVAVNFRPSVLSPEHQYNLNNQGWTSGGAWQLIDNTNTVSIGTGSKVFTVTAAVGGVNTGDLVQITGAGLSGNPVMTGTVTSYVGTALTVNVFSSSSTGGSANFVLTQINVGYINTWFSGVGNYPSNADVWWLFKNSSGTFDPTTTVASVTLNTGYAARGHFVLDAFNQQRNVASGVSGLTAITTAIRPRTGTWFQGRVWYTGVDASQAATGDAPYYTWTENIYFSQTITSIDQFGFCYQNNDPTSEDFFDLLPTDGGVITIQGCGSIYKLFPIQNGLLVFAANGIWFITGSQGIGFSANDYTITKISSVQSISSTSFVDVLGYPVFWNEEGIYDVQPSQQGGGLQVNNLCWGTILSFYNSIPVVSKKYVRGDYNPIDFVVKWVFKDTTETSVTDRYRFNRILNYNTANKSFYPASITTSSTGPFIHDVKFINDPGGSSVSYPAVDKYLVSSNNISFTFAEENDYTNWMDFEIYPYTSYFTTGFRVHGQALRKFQPVYLLMYSDGSEPTAYKIQGIWDFAGNPNSGRYSTIQMVTNALTRFSTLYRRHKIRGRGVSLQFKVISVDGLPFNIIGWGSQESQNASI